MFALKRRKSIGYAALTTVEALATFEKPTEHVHYISTDDATGWKLVTASFMSRSHTLVQAQKHSQISHNAAGALSSSQTSHSHSERVPPPLHVNTQAPPQKSGTVKRPSRAPLSAQPLLDVQAEFEKGFTGKGLLRRASRKA